MGDNYIVVTLTARMRRGRGCLGAFVKMSVVQVMGGGGGGFAGDRTPFFGIKVPPEVKKLAQLSKSVDQATFKTVLRAVVQYMETGSGSEEVLTELQSERCHEEALRALFSGILSILTAALRQPNLKQEVFKEDLLQIKLPGEVIASLTAAVSGTRLHPQFSVMNLYEAVTGSWRRSKLDSCLVGQRARLPHVEGVRWRVDVTISNSSLTRVLEPTILMEMTLSNGSIKTFEVPISKFHELRYDVAYVLKEMEDLEKRNILKLQD